MFFEKKARIIARSQVLEIINNTKNKKVYFDDKFIERENNDSIFFYLRNMNIIKSHHSNHIYKFYLLKICDNKDTLILKLYPDSEINNEYWVFYDKFKSTSINDIGKIRTNIFEEYK